MTSCTAVVVDLRGEDALHDGRRGLQVVASLEEGRDAHGLLDARRLLQQAHREDIRGVVRHRDHVGAHALDRQLRDDGEGVEDLLDGGLARQLVEDEERPIGGELLLDPLALLLLSPLEKRAEAEVAGDRVERLGVPLAFLSAVEAGEREAEVLMRRMRSNSVPSSARIASPTAISERYITINGLIRSAVGGTSASDAACAGVSSPVYSAS